MATHAKPQAGLTPEQQTRLAEMMNRMTPKERKRLAKAVTRMTPEQHQQFVAGPEAAVVEKENSEVESPGPSGRSR